MKNKFGYSLVVATMINCFSPMVYASDQKESYEELHKKFKSPYELESQKILEGNKFFKDAAENLPINKYVIIEKSILEHILSNVPSSSILFANTKESLIKMMDTPFDRVRMAYYPHKSEIEYELISNYQVIHTDKDVNITQPVMLGIVQTLNALGQKYFLKTNDTMVNNLSLISNNFDNNQLKTKIDALQEREKNLVKEGSASLQLALENLPSGKYVIVERPVFEHILQKVPSSFAMVRADPIKLEEWLSFPFERVRVAYYAHRSEIEYELIGNNQILFQAKDQNINEEKMREHFVPAIDAIAKRYFARTSK